MRDALWMAFTAVFALVPEVPVAPERSRAANAFIEAVSNNDGSFLSSGWRFEKGEDDGFIIRPRYMNPDSVLLLLSGCKLVKEGRSDRGLTLLHYSCPARNMNAKGCENGDLSIGVFDHMHVVIAEVQKMTPECGLFVPPTVRNAQ